MKYKFWKELIFSVIIMAIGFSACGKPNENIGVTPAEDTGNAVATVTITPTETPGLKESTLPLSPYTNPVNGVGEDGILSYGGDPSALVDGDTVYIYCGHDTAKTETYVIPEYLCFSSKNMLDWTYEGVVLSMKDVVWSDNTSAWASQVCKHFDKEAGKDKYYLYYCSWDKTASGKQSIGVAVSESPTGPFVDIGESLVKGTLTTPQASNWDDIDPTVWVETDEKGEEHRYLGWGNSRFYICELNEDMISVKDYDGDGQITYGKDIKMKMGLSSYTEAPWLYRRQNENGEYYGDYYLIYASGWREEMAYATTDDLMEGRFEFGDCFMDQTTTSNTTHMGVIDFKGETYLIYHNGSLDKGSGYRRSTNVMKLDFDEAGAPVPVEETAAGLGGTTVSIRYNGKTISHGTFNNSASDTQYPYMSVVVGVEFGKNEKDGLFVITAGKAGEKADGSLVSIQSENKQGLYFYVLDGKIVLGQNAQDMLDSEMTFKVYEYEGKTVLESYAQPGMYVGVGDDGSLVLVDEMQLEKALLTIE